MVDPILLQRTGDKIPAVGLGTYKITNDQGEEAIYNAIKVGYRYEALLPSYAPRLPSTYYSAPRHIDTASVYANEQGVGRGIKKAIDEGIVTRKDLFGKWDDAGYYYSVIGGGYHVPLLDAHEVVMTPWFAHILSKVVTKLWNAFHRKEHVRPAFDRQLKDLGLDYIDLYYMHCKLSITKDIIHDS